MPEEESEALRASAGRMLIDPCYFYEPTLLTHVVDASAEVVA